MKLFLKILLIITWAGFVAGAIVLMSFANRSHSRQYCSGVVVNVCYGDAERLITPEIIKSQLQKEFGKFENKLLGDISVGQVNRFMQKNQYLLKSDVHLTVEGELVVDATQCKPILRVLTMTGSSYYIDEQGKIMQADSRFPVRVVVASGQLGFDADPRGKDLKNIMSNKKGITPEILNIDNAFKVSQVLESDSIMQALTEQIYIPAGGSIALITKTGNHTVLLGDASNLEEKFANLKTFYRSGLPKVGWDRYRSINLAYKNQIICTK